MNDKGALEFLWTHGVISDEVWANILCNCSFPVPHDLCSNATEHTFEAGKIDCYNLYAPVCLQSPNGTYYSSSFVRTVSNTMPCRSNSSSCEMKHAFCSHWSQILSAAIPV